MILKNQRRKKINDSIIYPRGTTKQKALVLCLLGIICLKSIVHLIQYSTVLQWRRKWQPTPVFLPGEFPRTEEPGRLQSKGLKESDTTQRLNHHHHCTANCVSWVPRLTSLDLGTNWTYRHSLWMELTTLGTDRNWRTASDACGSFHGKH